jgi:tRNA-dihydrouridine synthase B
MDKSGLARYLSTPLAIGNKTIDARMVLAPMAGLGHVVFRELVAALGGFGLLFTGICSAKAFPHDNPAISPVFGCCRQELPYTVCQIGAYPANNSADVKRAVQLISTSPIFPAQQ